MWSAYVDESGSNRTKDPGTYIIAAAIAEDVHVEELTVAVGNLRLQGQRKLHWNDESSRRKQLIIEAIASLPLEHLVVVRTELGVAEATFESRGQKDDQRDLKALQAFRASKTISSALRIYHQPGPAQPLLWIPDAVCGAVTADRTGEQAYLHAIRSSCTFYTI